MRDRSRGVVHHGRLQLFVLVLLNYCGGWALAQGTDNGTSTDAFIEECRQECALYRNVMSCGKYQAVRWINDVVQERVSYCGYVKSVRYWF